MAMILGVAEAMVMDSKAECLRIQRREERISRNARWMGACAFRSGHGNGNGNVANDAAS